MTDNTKLPLSQPAVQFTQEDYQAYDEELRSYIAGARDTTPKLSNKYGVMENGKVDPSLYESLESQAARREKKENYNNITINIGREPLPGEVAGQKPLNGSEPGNQLTPGEAAGHTPTPGELAGQQDIYEAGRKAGNGGGYYGAPEKDPYGQPFAKKRGRNR